MLRFRSIAGCLLVALPVAVADAGTIDFNGLAHGTVVNTQYQGSHGVTISVLNHTGSDLAVVFDADDLSYSEDPDLQGPAWSGGGNLAGSGTVLDKLLIIQEHGYDDNGMISTRPDDEGSRPAGVIYFDFANAIDSFGFDLVDVEGPTEYGNDSGYMAVFFDENGVELARVGFGDFLNNASSFYDPTVSYGNNSANRIAPITATALGVNPFSRVEINLGGSAAVDNITYATAVPLPPAVFAGFGLLSGIGAVSRWRQRRAAAV